MRAAAIPRGYGGPVRGPPLLSSTYHDPEEAHVKLSARNKLEGTVTSITRGEAIANVVLDVSGQRLVSSITVEAARELGLREGGTVTAIIKESDVMIATD